MSISLQTDFDITRSDFDEMFWECGISRSEFEKEFRKLLHESGIPSSDFEKYFGKLFSQSGISIAQI